MQVDTKQDQAQRVLDLSLSMVLIQSLMIFSFGAAVVLP